LMGFLKVEAPNVISQIAMAVVGAVVFFLIMGALRFKKKKKDEDDE
jgi:hypothetical protein